MNRRRKICIIFLFLCVSQIITAGDDPCSSTSLNFSDSTLSFDNSGNTESGVTAPPYGDYNSPDFWFSFTMPNSGSAFLFITPGSMENPALAVYQGPCNDLKLLYNVVDNNCDGSEGPSIEFDDLDPGEEYFIRAWPEGNSSNGSFSLYFNDVEKITPQFNVFADASFSGDCITLTEEQNTQNGCAWYEELIDFSQPFTHTMTANFGDKDANGADGICLVYQNNSSSLCGISGGGIGALGMPNSAIFEFDTWQNGGYNDPFLDHCAFNINGDMDHNNSIDGPTTLGNIEDGADHEIILTWDPAGNSYEVFFDGGSVLSGTFDIINNCFGGSNTAYWGYTSATGGSNNLHSICPQTIEYDFGTQEYLEEDICDGSSFQGFDEAGFHIDVNGGGDCSHQQNIFLTLIEMDIDLYGFDYIDCNDPTTEIFSDVISDYNFTYLWSTNNGVIDSPIDEESIIVSAEGFYTLEVTDSNGCMEEQMFQIFGNFDGPDIDLDPVDILTCDFTEVTLSFTSIETVTSEWFDTSGISILEDQDYLIASDPGIYTVVVTGMNGCSSTGDFEVIANVTPPDLDILSAGTLDCSDAQVTLSAESSSVLTDYIWNTGDTLSQINTDAAGTYTLTVTGGNGCISSDTIELINPDLEFTFTVSDSTLNCTLQSYDFNPNIEGNYAEVLWQLPNNDTTSSESLTINQPGIYILQVTDDDNCLLTDSMLISIDTITPTYSYNIDTITCLSSGSVQINTPEDFQVSWDINGLSFMDTSIVYSDVEADAILSLVADNGCSLIDTLAFISNVSVPSYVLDFNNIDCDDMVANVSLESLENLDISWVGPNGFSSMNTEFSTVESGVYFLSVTNDADCIVTDSIDIKIDTLVPNLQLNSPNQLNCLHTESQLNIDNFNPLHTYQWYNANQELLSNEENLTISTAGYYYIEVIGNNACVTIDSLLITIDTLLAPTLFAVSDIDCNNPESVLHIIDPIDSISYQWDINGASYLQDSLTYSQSGNGTLHVLNTSNFCNKEYVFQIDIDTMSPALEYNYNHIDCTSPIAVMEIVNPQSDIDYLWTYDNEEISDLSWSTSQNIEIDVTSLNPSNGCHYTESFEILIDTIAPAVNLETVQIGCLNPLANISIDVSNDTWTNQWNFNDQEIAVNDTFYETDQPGEYSIEVTNPDNGCSTEVQTVILNYTPLNLEYLVVQPDCDLSTGQIIIEDITGGKPDYRWSFNNGETFTDDVYTFTLNPGNHNIIVIDDDNCTQENTITINEITPVQLSLVDTIDIIEGQSIQLYPELNIDISEVLSIEWSPSDLLSCGDCWDPIYLISTDTSFTLTVTDINGCMDIASIYFRAPFTYDLYIPNIFTPHNKDGSNDYFFPYASLGSVQEVSLMEIYDRWGNRVFSKEHFPINNEEHAWDGTFKNTKLNPAVFTYLIKIILLNDEEIILSGNVTLVD